jgi:predicted ArsR family transcriptional regulator
LVKTATTHSIKDAALLSLFGSTQQQLLKEIFKSVGGLTVDELVQRLGVTRTAVHQHLAILEKDGFLVKGELQDTGGRPGRRFLLSQKGTDVFPKQYSWFSGVLLAAIKSQSGQDGLSSYMKQSAQLISGSLVPRIEGKDRSGKLEELVKIMNELAYEASLFVDKDGEEATVEASNCVYHNLAQEHPEVCDFDTELMKQVTDSEVVHQECMVRGGRLCRFRLIPNSK